MNSELPAARQAYVQKRVRRANDLFLDSLDGLKAIYAGGMNLVWSQEGDVGPANIFEELGPEGAKLFIDGAALLTFILTQDPDWVYPGPTHEYVLNEDGTVTLGDRLEPETP